MLFKRGRFWWVSFTMDGKRYRQSTKSTRRLEAQEIAAHMLMKAKRRSELGYEPMTLRETAERWLTEHYLPREPRPRTRFNTENNLAVVMREIGPDTELGEISTARISEYKSALIARGLGAGTINIRLGTLSILLHFAHRQGVLPVMPRIERLPTPAHSERVLTDDEIDKLMTVAPEHLSDLILLLTETALRLSEALELKWADVTMPTQAKRGSILVKRSKAGRPRTVPMTETLAKMLKRRYENRAPACEHVISYRGEPMAYPKSSFATARKAAGLGPDVTIHRTRHTAITRMIQAGVHPFVVGRITGQRGTSIVERYTHVDTRDLEAGIEALETRRAREVTEI